MRARFALCAFVALGTPAHAFSLSDAVRWAQTHSPELAAAAQARAEALGAAQQRATYRYNPEVSFKEQRRRLASGGASRDWYFTISQRIELGGKLSLRRSWARLEQEAAAWRWQAARWRVAVAAARAYLELGYAIEALRVQEDRLRLWRRWLRALRQREHLGDLGGLALSLVRAEYAAALDAWIQASRAKEQALARYRFVTGGAPLPDRLPRWQPSGSIRDFEALWQRALQTRPDLVAQQLQLRQAEIEAQLAKAARIPDPSFSLMVGREVGDRLFLVGVQLPLPLWNANAGARRAAAHRLERLQAQWQAAKQQLRLDLQAAVSLLQQLDEAMQEAQAQAVGAAEEAFEKLQRAYELGEIGMERFALQARRIFDARLSRLALQRDAWLAKLRVAEVSGRPLWEEER